MGKLAGLLVAAGLLMIAGGAASVYAQSTTTVQMREFEFIPATIRLAAGRDTFTLQNTGQFPHNVHIEGNGVSVDVKADGPVAGGESFSGAVTLAPGTYDIWCPVSNHRDRGMVGTLTVAGVGAAAPAQVPTALPRTGEGQDGAPIAQASILAGLLLLGAGLFSVSRALLRRS